MKRQNSLEKKIDKDNKLDVSEGIEYKPLCPLDISKITSVNALFSRKYSAYDLIANFKRNLQIRCYMDYYGGYAEHGRQVVFGLHDTGRYNIKVTNIKTPVDIDPLVWQKVNWFTTNQINVKESDFMVIAGPGWLQKKFLPDNRRVIGWTMIESMNYSKECEPWLQNADVILCPTDIDVRRARDAGVNNTVKMKLGYDEVLWNNTVKPIEICGIPKENFVFGVLGSWNVRKGVKDIIKAYCKRFDKNSETTLLLCCKYGNRAWGKEKENKERWTIKYEFNEILKEIGKPLSELPHISLIDVPVHELILPHIVAKFNCLVGFSSGESTWLPGIQAMAMGIPIVQLKNECCGYMEYLNDENSWLCEKVTYRKANEEFWKTTSEYYENQTFGFGDYTELADKMDEVYTLGASGEISTRVDKGLLDVKGWTWKESISQLDSWLVAPRNLPRGKPPWFPAPKFYGAD